MQPKPVTTNNSQNTQSITEEQDERSLFLNFTRIQRVGVGSDSIEMTDGRAGDASTSFYIKQEPDLTDQKPIINRTIHHRKRSGDTLINPDPEKRPRVIPTSLTPQNQLVDTSNTISECRVEIGATSFQLGKTFFNLKDYAEAKKRFEECLEIPEYIATLTGFELANFNHFLGIDCFYLKDYAETKKRIEACLEIPEYIATLTAFEWGKLNLALGIACCNLKDYAGAKKRIEACLEIPEYIAALIAFQWGKLNLALGIACNNLKDYAGAKKAFEACLNCPAYIDSLTPIELGGLNYNLGLVYKNLEDYNKLKKAFEACLNCPAYIDSLTPIRLGNLNLNLGFAYFHLADYAEAKKGIEACLEIPEYMNMLENIQKVEIYSRLSQCCMQCNDSSRSIVYILTSLDYAKNVSDTDQLKVDALSFYKTLGSPQEILVQLLVLLTPNTSTIPIKDVWRAIGILSQINQEASA